MTATMLSRNASLPVEFVLEYATPIPFSFWPISVKKTVPFSLPSSVFMKICPCTMLPVGVNLAMALPVSLVFTVSVELGIIITSWHDTLIHFYGISRNTCIGSKALYCCGQQCCAKACG